VINDYEELCSWYDILSKHNNEIIISEIVPGPDENLYYAPSYRTRDGKYLGIFVGQKVRVTPVHFGSASYVELCKRSELELLTKQILDKLNYVGLSGIEYKYDETDKKYKLIEINARYGLWDCLGEAIGIDLAYIAYCDVLGMKNGLKVVDQPEDKKKIAWLSFERDIDAFRGYKRENDIQIVSWLKTLTNVKKYSIFDMWDLKPYLSRVRMNFFDKYGRYFLKKIPGLSLLGAN
jgi:predicted ATP-grasp superfamily ATP-dependent carboligase